MLCLFDDIGIKISFCLLIAIFAGCSHQDQIQKLDNSYSTSNELIQKIEFLRTEANVTGLSIAIHNQGKVVYEKAFGYSNYDTKDTLSTEQVFYGASLSKAVFGYLIAQLVAEGILDLDKPLQEYLDQQLPDIAFEKEWRGYSNLKGDERYKRITARMCMNHTTGFPNWRWMTKDFDFDRKGKIRFLVEPGTRYSYSGEGIQLLQFVVEIITGFGLEEMAQDRIFKPLQMNNTSYVWQKAFESNFCNGHNIDQEVIEKDTEDEANAAGSLETTIEDYAKFCSELLRLYRANSKITELMFSPSVRINSKRQFGFQSWEDTADNDDIELSYGIGWGILISPYGKGVFKEGHGEGFQHYSVLFPEEQKGIIIMSNSDNAESIFKEILEITIGDIYTPWEWERYIPYDQK